MVILLELAEVFRAFGFPGSDALIILSGALLVGIVIRLRLSLALWMLWLALASLPIIYAVISFRADIALTAFSISLFFSLLLLPRYPTLAPLTVRFLVLVTLLLTSYIFSFGDPIYPNSRFNQLFPSGNAFIYYLVLTACIIAFTLRQTIVSAALSTPFLLMQTKSAAVLLFSHRAMILMAVALAYPTALYLATRDRFAWFLDNYGLIYTLASGRIERAIANAADAFSVRVLLIGSPSKSPSVNFEIEFLDFVHDFGVFYSIAFFSCCIWLIRNITRQHWIQLTAVFLLLNLAGHFWNNPVIVIAFCSLCHYVCTYRN